MARRKFKVSKSIVARLAAIGVLSGMGGVAIYQSQQSKPENTVAEQDQDDDGQASDEDENSDSEEGDGSGGDGGESGGDGSGSSLRIGDQESQASSGGTGDSLTAPSRSNRIMPSAQPGQPSTRAPSISINDQGSGSPSGAGGLSMPSSRPPASPPGSPTGSSARPSSGLAMPGANPSSTERPGARPGGTADSLTVTRPGTTPPPTRSVSMTDQNPATGPDGPDPIGPPPSGGASSGLAMPGTSPSTSPGTSLPTQPDPSNLVTSESSDTAARNGDGLTPPLPGVNDLRGTGSAADSGSPGSPSGTLASVNDTPNPAEQAPNLRVPGADSQASDSGSLARDGLRAGAAVAGAGALIAATQDTPSLSQPPSLPSTSPPSTSLSDIPSSQPGGGAGTNLANPNGPPSGLSNPSLSSTGSQVGGSGRTGAGAGAPGTAQAGNLNVPSMQTGAADPLGPPNTATQGRGATPNNEAMANPYATTNSTTPSTRLNDNPSSQTPSRYPANGSGYASSGNPDQGNPSQGSDPYGGNRYSSTPQVNASAVSDTPGGIELDGAQSPSLAMEKRAPREIQVGRLATFETVIQNVGPTEAVDVIVTDRIPAGTRLESVTPEPISNSGGLLVWNLGSIKSGRAQTITMNLVPERRGEIGSVAQVTFNAKVGVRTVCTQPKLEIDVEAPEKVLIGQDVVLRINIVNNGDGAASNVIIEEDVPDGVSHPEGREIQYPLGNLGPGERRQLALTLRAEQASKVRNIISVRGDDNAFDESQTEFEVIAPSLQVTMSGPRKRYLERTTIHQIRIENRGTAPATRVEIVAQLPKGLKFQETNNHGTYDQATHSVYWGLESLPEGTVDDSIQLVTLPVEPGDQHIDYQATADLNLADSRRQSIEVVQLAELFFDIDDVADPIEVNGETMYHLRVTNQGSKVATQVRLMVEFPAALQPTSAEGPIKHTLRDQTVFFDPIERIAPGEEVQLKLHARGLQAGDHRVVVSLTSDDNSSPVVKQASTNVYVDR